jgi:pantetheine-phosphate adenylyltransferase
MIEQGARLFDRLVVAIGVNPDKRPSFPTARRLELTTQAISEAGIDPARIEVVSYEELFLVDFARSQGADILLRGLRNEADFAYEMTMRQVNGDLAPEILTVMLTPPRELREVSSGFVRGLVGYKGWREVVARYVTPGVLDALEGLEETRRG